MRDNWRGPCRSAIDAAVFATMKGQGLEAVVVQPIFADHHDHIVGLAARAGLPVISDHRHFAEAGALLTYGMDDRIQMRRSTSCVDRIRKGESPAEMPIEQSTKFYMAVNRRTAAALGHELITG